MKRFRAFKSTMVNRIATLVGLIFLCGHANADTKELFIEDEILSAVLTAPISQTYSEKKKDVRLYVPGTLSYIDDTGSKQTLELSIRTRGMFRRSNCRLPPLRLNFKKKSVAKTLFAGQNKLKLVSPCTASKRSQQQLLKEYLTYRVFEILTDSSLKTRLVRMSYVDSDGKKKPWTHLTFLIEEESDLAKRHGLRAITLPTLEPRQLDAQHTALVELFQYMIGNTDYSTLRSPEGKDCCHNMQIIGIKDSGSGFIPVPYDFDSAGLVDASYAAPSESLKIRTVKQRLFRGRCRTPEVSAVAIQTFKGHQTEILQLFQQFEPLSKHHRKKSITYLNQFFAILDDPEAIEDKILKHCRQ